MNWKFGGALACLVLPIWGASLTGATPDRGEARALYRRPSETPYPESNTPSTAKVDLGRKLFFDTRLSGSGRISCATCHRPDLGWSDGRARSVGEGGREMDLRSPTLLNVAWVPRPGWDGKFRSIEAVTFRAITAESNMNLSEAEVIARLQADPDYARDFEAAFGEGGITKGRVEMALATFQRLIVSGEAPFDRWVAGDEGAIPAAAKRGFALFNGRAGCAACHSGWALTDSSFHDIGTAEGADIGRGRLFPGSVTLRYAFKTPTLRDVAGRAPYMHDGSLPTLEAVIDLYDRGGIARESRSEAIRPLGLDAGEKADLVAFLRTLTADEPARVP